MPRKAKPAISTPSTDTPSSPIERSGSDGDASAAPTGKRDSQRPFGGLTPQEAALRRAEKDRAREAERATLTNLDLEDVRFVTVPIPVGRIIAKYSAGAEGGNVQAGRELRSWLEKYPATEASTDVAALDKRDRDRLVVRLMLELEREEGDAHPLIPA